MKDEISDYIKKCGIENNVSIFSDKPDIPRLLSISDIFVHSSLGEGCSNAILEAKAAGLRVVASNTGGTKEIVDSYDYLYEYKNDEDLKSKLVHALNLKKDKAIQEIIQNNSKEKFSVDSLLNSYNNILDIVTKRNN
jgi:glycosyltransferase involved in cell wall biosynthesis